MPFLQYVNEACVDEYKEFAKNHNWIDQSITQFDYWTEKNI